MPTALAPTAPYWEEAVAGARAAAVARTLEEANLLPHMPGDRAGYVLRTNGVADVLLEYRDPGWRYGIVTHGTAHRYGAVDCPDCGRGQYEQERMVREWVNVLDRAGWWAREWTPERRHHAVGGVLHTSLRCGVTVEIPREPRRATPGPPRSRRPARRAASPRSTRRSGRRPRGRPGTARAPGC
ncbi:hypothetical protein [Streptomyces sp. NPDC058548]|uniref:hypothetical protein n=1 Tax=Streptomyces sp. NPDC058548 TaxID=3346545 RepID=UPI0036610FB5